MNNRLKILTFLLTLSIIPPSKSELEGVSTIRLPSEDDVCPVSGRPGGSCPVSCFKTDPVCGVDGVTYWCGCAEAECAGVNVGKIGFCEVGNGGPGPLSGQALLLVHMVWLIVIGFSLLCGIL